MRFQLFLLLTTLLVDAARGDCEFPQSWRLPKQWWQEYVNGTTDVILQEFTKDRIDIRVKKSNALIESHQCKDLHPTIPLHYYLRYPTSKPNEHVCMEVFTTGQVLTERQSNPLPDGLTNVPASQCSMLMRTALDSPAKVLVKYPFDFSATSCPFPRGSYHTTIDKSDQETGLCENDLSSETIVAGNQLKISSCLQGSGQYENPFETTLTCVEYFSASVAGFDRNAGQIVILALTDKKSSKQSFYCGKYNVDVLKQRVYLSISVMKTSGLQCESRTGYTLADDTPTSKHRAFQLRPNECDKKPCQHGGTCTQMFGDYRCTCVAGYTGKSCETDIKECDSKPCLHDGMCIDGLNTFTCNCSSGWWGTNCEYDFNECGSNPCQNNGTCLDRVNGYFCSCKKSYIGPNCEATSPCLSNPCQNGGTCYDREWTRFQCSCKDGFMGSFCDKTPQIQTQSSIFGEFTWPSMGIVFIILLVVVLVSVSIVALLICLVKKSPLPDKANATDQRQPDEEGATGKTESDEELGKKGNAWYPSYKSTKL